MRAIALTLGLVSASAFAEDPVASRAAAGRKAFLTPSQIAERIAKSKVEYRVAAIETLLAVPRAKLADVMWPAQVPVVDYPKVVRSGANVTITNWLRTDEVSSLMAKGEQSFRVRDYATAGKQYSAALAKDPKFYPARAFLGDTLLYGKRDPEAAIVEYDKAIAINPDDARLYFFRANAQRSLKHAELMLADFRKSLVLRPRNGVVIGAVQGVARDRLRLEADVFVPRAFVRREDAAVAIFVDLERPEWLAWANCKALWLGEPSHRTEMLGSAKAGWSTIEELECLASLIAVYETRKASKEGMTDDRLDRLSAIAHDGLLAGFVIYEIGSRVDPQIVLRLSAELRALVERYVEKYVLTLSAE